MASAAVLDSFDQVVAAVVAAAQSAGALGVSAADTNSTLPVTLNGRFAASRRPALVDIDHAGVAAPPGVVLLDPHRQALLVEGHPDDERSVDDGRQRRERTERIRPKLPRGKCSK